MPGEDSDFMVTEQPPREELTGFGGWLALFTIGMVVSLVLTAIQVIALVPILPLLFIDVQTSVAAIILLLEVAFDVILIVQYFRRRACFFKFYAALILLNAMSVLVQMLMGDVEAVWGLFGVAVGCAWLAYFYKSRRVRKTFH